MVRKVFEPCENLVWCDIIMHYTRFLLYCINWWRRYICIYITLPPLFRKVFEPCENLVYKFSWDKEIKLAQYVHKETIFNKEFSITKLSVYLSVYSSIYPSVYQFIYLSICLSLSCLFSEEFYHQYNNSKVSGTVLEEGWRLLRGMMMMMTMMVLKCNISISHR